MNKTRIICISGMIIAMYIAIMFVTQAFAFGAYQIRIATALYSLSYVFPFLVLPLALANGLGNSLGGFGILDLAGGFIVGIITSGTVYLTRRFKLPMILIIPTIILGPALIVPIWLSRLLGIPYIMLVLSIGIGQVTPAILGYILIKVFGNHIERMVQNGDL